MNSQSRDILLYISLSLLGFYLLLSHLIELSAKQEETWPHPAITIPGSKDARIVEDANRNLATVLGYKVHREPWLWPDSVRMKHGLIAGGTGAGKSTFLENLIVQDLNQSINGSPMPHVTS